MSAYTISLDDLKLIADAACELDCYRDILKHKPAEHARVTGMVTALHSLAERSAAADAALIYGPEEGVAA